MSVTIEQGDALVIRHRWFRMDHLGNLAVGGAGSAFLIFGTSEAELFRLIFLVVFGAVALSGLAGVLNISRVVVEAGWVRARHGPIWLPGLDLPVASIGQLFVRRRSFWRRHGGVRVEGVLVGGERRRTKRAWDDGRLAKPLQASLNARAG